MGISCKHHPDDRLSAASSDDFMGDALVEQSRKSVAAGLVVEGSSNGTDTRYLDPRRGTGGTYRLGRIVSHGRCSLHYPRIHIHVRLFSETTDANRSQTRFNQRGKRGVHSDFVKIYIHRSWPLTFGSYPDLSSAARICAKRFNSYGEPGAR